MDPLKDWQKISSDKDFSSLPDEDKAALRQKFITNTAGEDPKISKFLDYATKDLEKDVFNDPEFVDLDEQAQKDIIKANYIASGKIKNDNTLKPRLGGLRQSYADELADKALESYKSQAVVAAYSSPILGAAQLAGTIGTEVFGTEGKTLKNANEAIREMNRLKKRAPVKAGAAEIGSQIGVGLLTPIARGAGFLGNLLRNAGMQGAAAVVTSPIQVEKGTPEQEAKDVISGKTTTGALTSGLSVAGDVVTSPAATNIAGDAKRWVQGIISPEGKVADIADDQLKQIIAQNKDTVASLKAQGKLAEKATPREILGTLQAEKARLEAASQMGGKDIMFTGQAAGGDSALKGLQTSVERTNPEQIIGRLEKTATPFAKTISEGIEDITPGSAAEYVRTKFQPSEVGQSRVKLDVATEAEAAKLKEEIQNIWTPARESGILKTPTGISETQYQNRISDALKDLPKKEKTKITSLLSRPKTLKGKINYDQVVLDKIDLLQAKTPQNAAFIDRVIAVQDGLIGTAALPEIKKLFEQTNAAEIVSRGRLAETRKALGIDTQIENSFIKEPIKKAFATNAGAKGLVDAALDSNTPRIQLDEILKDKVLGKNLRSAVASDITDTLNLANIDTAPLEMQKLAQRYAGKEEVVREIFKDNPDMLNAFNQLMDAGTATGQIRKSLGRKSGESGVKGSSYPLQAAAGQATGVRTGALGMFESIRESLNKGTRNLLRESITDKALALKILSKAEDIQKGRIKYTDIWNETQGIRGAAAKVAAQPMADEVFSGRPDAAVEPPVEETPGPQSSLEGTERQDSLTRSLNNDIIPTIEDDIAAMGLKPAYLKYAMDITGVESDNSTDVNLPTWKKENGEYASSAKGPAQFLDKTWNAMSKLAEETLGRPLDKANIKDHLIATALYGKQNFDFLSSKGYPTNQKDLYVAHAWGPGDADRLYRNRGKGVLAKDVLSKEARDNHPAFALPGYTVDQVLTATKNAYTKKSNNTSKQAKLKEAAANG